MTKLYKNIVIAVLFAALILGLNTIKDKDIIEASSLEDPLTTLSYVEMRLGELEKKILDKVETILSDFDWDNGVELGDPENQPEKPETPEDPNQSEKPENPETPENPNPKESELPEDPEPVEEKEEIVWEVILLKEEESLIAEAGCEIILRSGSAHAIAAPAGGIADLTAGVDLTTGADVKKNHLLLIPRTDGRGIKALEQSYVMVKGKYSIE